MLEQERNPYLSVVVASRNDEHGGNLLHRMQVFVNGLLEQCRRHDLNAELVVVEWNPPAGRPHLEEALSWPMKTGTCMVRIIEVPPKIHRRFRHSDTLPLLQMIAKNVGIRRARGKFVLATNIDILFSDELVSFLASGRLRRGRLYRVDRCDVPADIPEDAPIESQLRYCRSNVLRFHGRDATVDFVTGEVHRIYEPSSVYERMREQITPWIRPGLLKRCRIHTNASGDFMLMAREHWFALRGYPELEVSSIHLDSLLCYMAHHGSAPVKVLREPMVVYHVEHERKSGDSMREAAWESMKGFVSAGGSTCRDTGQPAPPVPTLAHWQLDAYAMQMRRQRKPILFNNEDWRLAREDLPERTML